MPKTVNVEISKLCMHGFRYTLFLEVSTLEVASTSYKNT